jgi:hypothetical protein
MRKTILILMAVGWVACQPGGQQGLAPNTPDTVATPTQNVNALPGGQLPGWVRQLPTLNPGYVLTAQTLLQGGVQALTAAQFAQLCPGITPGKQLVTVGRVQLGSAEAAQHWVLVASQNPTPPQVEVTEYAVYACVLLPEGRFAAYALPQVLMAVGGNLRELTFTWVPGQPTVAFSVDERLYEDLGNGRKRLLEGLHNEYALLPNGEWLAEATPLE